MISKYNSPLSDTLPFSLSILLYASNIIFSFILATLLGEVNTLGSSEEELDLGRSSPWSLKTFDLFRGAPL